MSGPSPCAPAASKSPATKNNNKKNRKTTKTKKSNTDGADSADHGDDDCAAGASSAQAAGKGKAPAQAGEGSVGAGETWRKSSARPIEFDATKPCDRPGRWTAEVLECSLHSRELPTAGQEDMVPGP